MRHGSLFSGIGGFDLAAEWMGWENVFHCEWNEFGQKILKHYWPNAKSYGDITKTDFTEWNGKVDIVSGGFPCQPFSVAGKRNGKSDTRYLWPEMLRAIVEIKPKYVVCENVPGLLSMENIYGEILSVLEDEGYKTETYIIPACAIGAIHRRDRMWLLAYSEHNGHERRVGENIKRKNVLPEIFFTRYKTGCLHEIEKEFLSKPGNRRNYDGLSRGVVKRELIAFGNAVVPQLVFEIFKAIEEFEKQCH